jgi:hypothetical protein
MRLRHRHWQRLQRGGHLSRLWGASLAVVLLLFLGLPARAQDLDPAPMSDPPPMVQTDPAAMPSDPPTAGVDPAPSMPAPATESSVDRIEYLVILPHAVQSIDFQSGVTRLVVTSEAGHTTLRCGDRQETYACTPGRSLTIERDPATALTTFQAQNDSDRPVRLKLRIERAVAPTL